MKDNKTVFFPEYTDHGITHLNEVLLTADSIISDESWLNLTPQDAAAMVISVLLHDCAMHITEDGFYSLINNKFPTTESRYIKKESRWSDVWQDFLSEARRFDAKKLKSIFNDENPIRNIPENKIDLTGRDKLLIGEFIRRHHARIAHEISFYGIPGVDGYAIKLDIGTNSSFLDLCGFIARSHNLGLRDAVDMLEKNKKQVHLNTHVPFIMLVLRISDYIQIHSERAAEQLLHLKTLVSPISRGEWKKHNSIVEINQAHEDPEAIYVDAEPNDAISYQELKKLFRDIQYELDLSWSLLGEVYGRYDQLNKLGITIRRIRSSLDSYEEFIENKKPKYIPKVLRFKTADSEMMELLIVPLYGDNPEVGIRELIQNSIDACSELNDSKVKKGLDIQGNSDFDVCVSLYDHEDNGGELVIEDYGIGMTIDVIEKYFLNIGASFRNSDRWKKEHETDGHSNVYRTGRFGIGLLAAYLLGDELEVVTRHYSQSEENALAFKCRKGCDDIVISHTKFHVGTKITIKISEHVKEELLFTNHWDWFSLSSPKVIRKLIREDKENILPQFRNVPNTDTNIENTNWHRTSANGYDDILWTYDEIIKTYIYNKGPSLICNGIKITDNLYLERFGISDIMKFIEAETPNIIVFDQDGRLPINLERSSLVSNSLPFKKEISYDISVFLVKQIISFAKSIESISLSEKIIKILESMEISGLRDTTYANLGGAGYFLIFENKLVPLDYNLIAKNKINQIYIDPINLNQNRGAWTSQNFISICDSYIYIDRINDSKSSRASFVRTFFEINENNSAGLSELPICGRRILIKKSDVKDIVSPGYVPRSFWGKLNCEWDNSTWAFFSIGRVPNINIDLEKITKDLDDSNSFGFVCCYLDWGGHSENDKFSIFYDAWQKTNNNVPFIQK